MLYYDVIDLSRGIDPAKSNDNKECTVYHYSYSNDGFRFHNFVCNCCHDLTMLCLNLSDIAITTVKDVNHRCIFIKLARNSFDRKFTVIKN